MKKKVSKYEEFCRFIRANMPEDEITPLTE